MSGLSWRNRPEADPATAHDQDDIRKAFDLDSMDFINLVTAIHEPTKIKAII
jgi:acyl carrier protein